MRRWHMTDETASVMPATFVHPDTIRAFMMISALDGISPQAAVRRCLDAYAQGALAWYRASGVDEACPPPGPPEGAS